jgi:hypothetical protein
MYILIILTNVYMGTTISQQAYENRASCEAAAEVVKELKPRGMLKLQCVPYNVNRP